MRKGLIFGLYFRDENKMLNLVQINRLGSCPGYWGHISFLIFQEMKGEARAVWGTICLLLIEAETDEGSKHGIHPSAHCSSPFPILFCSNLSHCRMPHAFCACLITSLELPSEQLHWCCSMIDTLRTQILHDYMLFTCRYIESTG